MIFKKKKAKKIKDLQLTDAEKRRVERLNREYKPTTQNTLRYATLYENEASLFETGFMHVAKNIYSQSISLQDINYMSAQIEDQLKVVKRLEQGVSALHEDNQFHLLIHNKPVGTDISHDYTVNIVPGNAKSAGIGTGIREITRSII